MLQSTPWEDGLGDGTVTEQHVPELADVLTFAVLEFREAVTG